MSQRRSTMLVCFSLSHEREDLRMSNGFGKHNDISDATLAAGV